MASSKEYIVWSDMKEAYDMNKYVFGVEANGICLSYHTLDKTSQQGVTINSRMVESIELNF